MSDCPICDTPLSEERPRYCAILEAEDTTRSAEAGEVTRGHVRRQLCHDCWEDLYGSLTGRANR